MKFVMKFVSTAMLLSLISAVVYAANPSAGIPEEINAPVEKIYIPVGFDDNDNIEVMVKGTFPNACYRIGHSHTTVDRASNTIAIELTAYRHTGTFCAQVLTPFLETVRLGLLPKGDYTVTLSSDSSVQQSMSVSDAESNAPDNHMYAPITKADIQRHPNGDKQLSLEGVFPRAVIGCAVLQKVDTYLNPEDVLVVLPIMGLVDDERCNNHSLEFTYSTILENSFDNKGLVHVRILNGQSHNRFIEFF